MKNNGLFIGLFVFMAATSVQASLITNGSFESGSIDPDSVARGHLEIFPGETSLTGWDVIVEDIHYVGSNLWPASDGIRSLDLDGLDGSAGGVSQTFATIVGETYNVIFDMAGNPGNLPLIKPMRVSADGQSQDFFFDITGKSLTDMGWITNTWSFVADDSSATLEFQSLTTFQGWGPALDNVIVNRQQSGQTPVPTTLALLAFGLVGIGHGRLRRKKA